MDEASIQKFMETTEELDMSKRDDGYLQRRIEDETEAGNLIDQAKLVYKCNLRPVFYPDNSFQMTIVSNPVGTPEEQQKNVELFSKYLHDVLANYNVKYTPLLYVDENKQKQFDIFLLTTW